ncbi:M28 family peptidase [Deinococcus ficus]|uniref:M28 family peptidase n=1 Tax=Deinococcus ficus TaxID=317577 RepID=UPI00174EC447|nr:M28 family peptidase [Deinococcus ficus]GHF88819.1 aminopeptidase [Deinococcus ficus]
MPTPHRRPTLRPLLSALLLIPAAGAGGSAAQTTQTAAEAGSIEANARAVLAFGPRVTGSPANEQARAFLETQLRALGYQTQRQTFTSPRFDDLGSGVQVAGQSLAGAALQGSAGGTVTAALVRVPGAGTAEDYRGLNVTGKIAVVKRGVTAFAEKARQARAAGAAGLIIVNTEDRELRGTLGDPEPLPVLAVRAGHDAALRPGATVTLNVRVRQGEVLAQNLLAFRAGTAPTVLIGAHMDSVQGAPGANDNLSGTLAVVDVARRAVNTPLSARAYFVLFDGEEDGLLGARDFVKTNPELVRGLKGMLNLDMVGVNAAPLTATGHPTLTALARALPGVTAVEGRESGSDHVPFDQAGVPTLFFHRGIDRNYHQPGDMILDPALVRGTADATLAVAQALTGPGN